MKKFILLGLCCFIGANVYAQVITADSAAYQQQRNKINKLLAERTRKFGQYDNSLNKHTGIFGLQTKKDIRRSNEILMDIVKMDNDIYKQIKILLDYRTFQLDNRTFQQNQLQDHSKEVENNAMAYMRTINRLREDNDKLKAQLNAGALLQQKTSNSLIAVLVVMIAGVLILLRRQFRIKKNN